MIRLSSDYNEHIMKTGWLFGAYIKCKNEHKEAHVREFKPLY